MALLTLTAALALTAAGSTPVGESASRSADPEPVYTAQTTFAIPFQVDRTGEPGRRPVEVQLFTSTDRGQTWTLQSRVDPGQGRFVHQPRGDGQYWFAIRTLDRSGRFEPPAIHRPGLRVVLDTTPPTLSLTAGRQPHGAVAATWEIGELNLDPESLRIAWRTSGGPWQSVPVDPAALRCSGPIRSGAVAWTPGRGPGDEPLEIAAEVADRAGNRTVALARLAAQPGATARAVGQAVQAPAPAPSDPNPDGPQATAANAVRQVSYEEPCAPAERLRVVFGREFDLDYGAGLLGGLPLRGVELWATRDGGRTWSRFGPDDDCRSPVRVRVRGPGLYGFRLVAECQAAPRPRPPQSGDRPDVWVDVRDVR